MAVHLSGPARQRQRDLGLDRRHDILEGRRVPLVRREAAAVLAVQALVQPLRGRRPDAGASGEWWDVVQVHHAEELGRHRVVVRAEAAGLGAREVHVHPAVPVRPVRPNGCNIRGECDRL